MWWPLFKEKHQSFGVWMSQRSCQNTSSYHILRQTCWCLENAQEASLTSDTEETSENWFIIKSVLNYSSAFQTKLGSHSQF